MTKADRLARKQAQKQVKETRAAAFPADLVNVLLQYLDSFQDVVSVGLVSRRFYQIALKDVKKPNYSQAKLLDRWTTEKIEIKPSHYSSSQILICPQLGKLLHGRQIEYKVDLENFKIAQKDPTQAKRIAEEKGHISAITTFRFGYAPKKCFYTSSGLLMEEKSFNEKMQEHGPRISYHIGTHPGHINPLKDEQPPLIKRREEMYVDGEIQGWASLRLNRNTARTGKKEQVEHTLPMEL